MFVGPCVGYSPHFILPCWIIAFLFGALLFSRTFDPWNCAESGVEFVICGVSPCDVGRHRKVFAEAVQMTSSIETPIPDQFAYFLTTHLVISLHTFAIDHVKCMCCCYVSRYMAELA